MNLSLVVGSSHWGPTSPQLADNFLFVQLPCRPRMYATTIIDTIYGDMKLCEHMEATASGRCGGALMTHADRSGTK